VFRAGAVRSRWEPGKLEGFCREEAAVVQRCRRGSREAFEVLVKRYMKEAYFIALGLVGNREDALDLSQEAFVRAFRHIRDLEPERRFFPWFYQILKNLCISHLRKRRRRAMGSLDEEDCPEVAAEVDGFSPEVVAGRKELKERLWRAIGQLDAKHREVIVLRHFRGMSYEQMAEVLCCSKGTVTSRLYYARQKLRELLISEKGGGTGDL